MKKFSIIIIILMLAVFITFEICRKSDNTVMKVLKPDILQIDLNNNKIIDDNETICVQNLETFTSNLLISQNELASKYQIDIQDAIALGYMTDYFAEKLIANKNVDVKFTGQTSPSCRYADVFITHENYAQRLYKEGYGIYNGKFNEKFNQNLERAKNLKLVILNHKSNKYHNLDCPYGLISHDTAVITAKELPADAQPCKFCHLTTEEHNANDDKYSAPPPAIITNGSVKFLLSDFTTQLKPDSNCSSQFCHTVLNEINNAVKSLDMAVYGWDKVPAIDDAIRKAIERGVVLRVVYDENSQNSNYYPDTPSLIAISNAHKSDKLIDAKMTNFLMHNKFVVIDNQKVLTGSMNYSRTGLSGFNSNNLILINSKDIAALYEEEFNQMLAGKFHTSKSKSKLSRSYILGTSKISVYFSPQDKIITNQLVNLVNSAQKYVYVPVFVITHPGLANSLINARKRGVDVRIIVDATNIYARHSMVKTLRDAGVDVKAENYAGKMHNKSIIIDDKYIVTGSMNFSNSGENKNDENVLIIEDARLAIFYRDFFNYIWGKIPDKYLKQNVRAEGWDSVGSCEDGIDNNFDGKIDMDDDGCRAKAAGK